MIEKVMRGLVEKTEDDLMPVFSGEPAIVPGRYWFPRHDDCMPRMTVGKVKVLSFEGGYVRFKYAISQTEARIEECIFRRLYTNSQLLDRGKHE